MPIDFDQHIDDYLLDRLSHEERKDFEAALVTNSELKAHFDRRTKIIKGAKIAGKKQLKERLKTIHQQVINETPIAKKRRIWPFLTAIAAAIVLLVVNFFVLPNNSSSPEQLFASNYEPYQISFANRSNTTNEDLLKINELYSQSEYAKTIPLLEKTISQDPNNIRLLIAAGICQLEIEKTETARSYFHAIINTGDLRLHDIANWYIALSYLKDNNPERALLYLKRIKQDKFEAAKKLINNLNNK